MTEHVVPQRLMDSEVALPGHAGRKGYLMHAFGGVPFFPCDPRPEEIFIEDIAHHLAMQCRFNGAVTRFYSVAEHSYHCSHHCPESEALECLLHDASEAYIGDMIRPLKMLPELRAPFLEIEQRVERAIAKRFKLVYPWPASVKKADEALVTAEMTQLIRAADKGHLHDSSVEADIELPCWAPDAAKEMFLAAFRYLARDRGLEDLI